MSARQRRLRHGALHEFSAGRDKEEGVVVDHLAGPLEAEGHVLDPHQCGVTHCAPQLERPRYEVGHLDAHDVDVTLLRETVTTLCCCSVDKIEEDLLRF